MLFNSSYFIFAFLPAALFAYFFYGRKSGYVARISLAIFSFAFYAYWDIRFLPLLIFSIVTNFFIGTKIAEYNNIEEAGVARKLTVFGMVFNLGLLTFFKYGNLISGTAANVFYFDLNIPEIILPIGISFFTFTQIAFLADAYSGKAKEYSFWDYALFVSYFPHQIAGPILHHGEMMNQFRAQSKASFSIENFVAGLSVFGLGLAKKILIADTISGIASPVFSLAENGAPVVFFEAWTAVAAFALQLYFDFSAYSDMAIGISLLFGIRLPLNFNSPYKACSIIDFWKRWHMTLSRFLRDYLYIPLGGSRHGNARRYMNLMITMGLGGLWHGAAWTFLAWGLLHGLYLAINHAWRGLVGDLEKRLGSWSWIWLTLSWCMTFGSVLVALAFFRADSFFGAFHLLKAMFGGAELFIPPGLARLIPFGTGDLHWLGSIAKSDALICIVLLAWCILAPNMQEFFRGYRIALDGESESRLTLPFVWKPKVEWALVTACVLGFSLSRLGNDTTFLYFNF